MQKTTLLISYIGQDLSLAISTVIVTFLVFISITMLVTTTLHITVTVCWYFYYPRINVTNVLVFEATKEIFFYLKICDDIAP